MELAFIVGLLLFGFVIGALARFAVPGPDPMPIWLTVAVGVIGSVGGASSASSSPIRPEVSFSPFSGRSAS